jgi:hypothetical protein
MASHRCKKMTEMEAFGGVPVHNVLMRRLQPETHHNIYCFHTEKRELNFRAPGLSRKNFSGGPYI